MLSTSSTGSLNLGRVVIPAFLLIRQVKRCHQVKAHTRAHETFLNFVSLQRDSQYLRKLRINTLLYGEGVKKLAHTLGVDVDRAKALLEMFFEPYPAIRDFIADSHRQAHMNHYVETIDGRPRRFPDMATYGHVKWRDLPPHVRGNIALMERQAVNSRIQGSAASAAKRAMIKCENSSRLRDLGVELLLQVHDELLFEVPIENADRAYRIIKKKMEHPLPYDLSVPLECDGGIGDSWAAAKA